VSMPADLPIVGRVRELDVLLDAFRAGRRGEPHAVVVRGEAGIGKTRLLQEFRARITALPTDGVPTLVTGVGQCVDLGPIESERSTEPLPRTRPRILAVLRGALTRPHLRPAH